jgi:hypothetical protein
MYSEGGGTARHHEDFGAASFARGGMSPSIISPWFKKQGLGQRICGGNKFVDIDTPLVSAALPKFGA